MERAVKRMEEGEAWEKTDEVVEIECSGPLAKVVSMRLPAEKWEELRHEARELGVGPTTLARMWILEKLRQMLVARPSARAEVRPSQPGRLAGPLDVGRPEAPGPYFVAKPPVCYHKCQG